MSHLNHVVGEIEVELEEQFRDYSGSIFIATLKELIRNKDSRPALLIVNMEKVEWADPLPLLALSALLNTYNGYSKYPTRILLGNSENSNKHKIFLKFCATQGFLSGFGKSAEIVWNGIAFQHTSIKKLESELTAFRQPLHHLKSDCILAKVFGVNAFRNDPEHAQLQKLVETLVREAQDRLIDSEFGNNPLVRDPLLQKIRKILFELISNVVEYAYPAESLDGYAGVYARMRTSRPSQAAEAEAWQKLLDDERKDGNCLAIRPFQPNPLAPWIEIYVCDVGVGLLHNLAEWKVPRHPEVEAHFQRLARATPGKTRVDRLRSIAKYIFNLPISSHVDRDLERSPVTGLLLLGWLLQQCRDFSRVSTEDEWIGNTHPWAGISSMGIGNVRKLGVPANYPDPASRGTWYAIFLQPDQIDLRYPKDKWIVPDSIDRETLIGALANPPIKDYPKSVLYLERRGDDQCTLPAEWFEEEVLKRECVFQKHSVVVLRPPRSLQKRQLGTWIQRMMVAAEYPGLHGKHGCFVIADLTPFQAITFAEILTRFTYPPNPALDIYLVTEDWAVACLTKNATTNSSQLKPDLELALGFLRGGKISSDTPPISCARLLEMLRLADSIQFWRPTQELANLLPEDIYLDKQIEWTSTWGYRDSDGALPPAPLLHGYLNLSRALLDHERYQACCRALRRCFNLFPDHVVLPSDELIHSVTFDADQGRYANLNRYRSREDKGAKKLIVGSIRATASTVSRMMERKDVPVDSRPLYIFSHPDAPPTDPPTLNVLDWMPPRSTAATTENVTYIRYPATPFIGRGGEMTQAIPRFKRIDHGQQKLESLYPRTPQQTYEDFHQLGALKMGHWVYGSSHDLLTLNLHRALEFSRIDKGMLFQWLKSTIEALCLKDGKPSAVVVYASHPVTDQMVASLEPAWSNWGAACRTPAGTNLQFGDFFFPMKFLKSSTISPLVAHPLTCEYLRKALIRLKEDGLAKVVLIDDGTISGKTLHELRELVQSMGAEEIHSIVLVDRTGLPTDPDFVDSHNALHHPYWRWDVPRLGQQRGCPLCAGLSQVAALKRRTESRSMQQRLEDWLILWRPRPVTENWEYDGLTPIPFSQDHPCDSQRFGIYPDQPEPVVHKILHRNSTGMTAGIMEIIRNTTRVFYAAEKAEKLVEAYGPEIGIEVLASQLLLFKDELTYWDRLDISVRLFTYLWKCEVDSPRTALAGLCFALIDEDIAPALGYAFRERILKLLPVRTMDARIAAILLETHIGSLGAEFSHLHEEPANGMEALNRLVLFSDHSFKQNIARVFQILGATPSGIHNMGLHQLIRDVHSLHSSNRPETYSLQPRLCSNLKLQLNDLSEALKGLHHLDFSEDSDVHLDPMHESQRVDDLMNRSPIPDPGNTDGFISSLADWSNLIRQEVLAPSGSLAARLRQYFVWVPADDLAVANFLDGLTSRVVEIDWPSIVQDRIAKKRYVSDRWTEQQDETISPSAIKPTIRCGNTGTWGGFCQFPIYYDSFVEHCLYEVMANCVHVTEDIQDPFQPPGSPGYSGHATLWWKARPSIKFLEIIFLNSCSTKEVNPGPTEARTGLERVGGELLSFVIERNADRTESVARGSFLDPELIGELLGLLNGQRIALILVRIPYMKSLTGA